MHEGFCHTRPILKFSLHHTVYKVCQTSQDVEMVEVNMDKRFECNGGYGGHGGHFGHGGHGGHFGHGGHGGNGLHREHGGHD